MNYLPAIAFLSLLGLGILGWYGLMTWPRQHAWWSRAASLLCFFGLTGAGMWMPDALSPVPSNNATRADATIREAMESDATERYAIGPKRLEERSDRYEQVSEEIGPPPHPDAIPVLGYTTTAGISYQARWRMPPNADKADNLK